MDPESPDRKNRNGEQLDLLATMAEDAPQVAQEAATAPEAPLAHPPERKRALRPSVRSSDPETSHQAWRLVKPQSARGKLLQAHADHPEGLTDPEACVAAGLSLMSDFASRCTELDRMGLIAATGETRVHSTGMSRMVRVITLAGKTALELPIGGVRQ